MTSPLLSARDVHFAYGTTPVLEGVTFDLRPGEFVGLVGPNGSGKSTLLKVLLGMLQPQRGEVRLDATSISRLTRREIARRVAFVPQDTSIPFDYAVQEIVTMGRYPYRGRFEGFTPEDQRLVEAALAATGTAVFRDRIVTELSGGERQRVILARGIAQGTPALLLDEPTSSLDIGHQIQFLEQLRTLAARDLGIVAAIHDLNLAARYCDRVVVLREGRVAADGTPGAVLTAETLREVFHIDAHITCDSATGQMVITALRARASLPGGLSASPPDE